MKMLTFRALAALGALSMLAGCGGASASHGDLERLQRLEQACADEDVAAYIAVDFSDTARSESLRASRRDAMRSEAERVAVCGGTLKIVAFSSSTAAIVTLFDGHLEAEGATHNARLRRINRTVDPVEEAVAEAWDSAEAELPGDGSDVLGQLTLASEHFAQRPGATHRALILTDGVQTTGTVVVNSPDFTSAVATDLAARVHVPDLSGVTVTVAGLGQVVGDPPPSEFVAALNTFFTASCARTNATCQIVTDLASN
jgi:hypothetical protein